MGVGGELGCDPSIPLIHRLGHCRFAEVIVKVDARRGDHRLAQHARNAGRVIAVTTVFRREAVSADRQAVGGEGGHAAAQSAGAQGVSAILERYCAGGGTRRDGGGERHARSVRGWVQAGSQRGGGAGELRIVEHRKVAEGRDACPRDRVRVESAARPIPGRVAVAAHLRIGQVVVRQDHGRHEVGARRRAGPVNGGGVRAGGVRMVGVNTVHLDSRERVAAGPIRHVNNHQARRVVPRQAKVKLADVGHRLCLADDALVVDRATDRNVLVPLGLNQRGVRGHRQVVKLDRVVQGEVLVGGTVEGDPVTGRRQGAKTLDHQIAGNRDVAGQLERAFGLDEDVAILAGTDQLALGDRELLGRLELAGGGDRRRGRILVLRQLVEGERARGVGGERLVGAAGQEHRAGAGSERAVVGVIAAQREGLRGGHGERAADGQVADRGRIHVQGHGDVGQNDHIVPGGGHDAIGPGVRITPQPIIDRGVSHWPAAGHHDTDGASHGVVIRGIGGREDHGFRVGARRRNGRRRGKGKLARHRGGPAAQAGVRQGLTLSNGAGCRPEGHARRGLVDGERLAGIGGRRVKVIAGLAGGDRGRAGAHQGHRVATERHHVGVRRNIAHRQAAAGAARQDKRGLAIGPGGQGTEGDGLRGERHREALVHRVGGVVGVSTRLARGDGDLARASQGQGVAAHGGRAAHHRVSHRQTAAGRGAEGDWRIGRHLIGQGAEGDRLVPLGHVQPQHRFGGRRVVPVAGLVGAEGDGAGAADVAQGVVAVERGRAARIQRQGHGQTRTGRGHYGDGIDELVERDGAGDRLDGDALSRLGDDQRVRRAADVAGAGDGGHHGVTPGIDRGGSAAVVGQADRDAGGRGVSRDAAGGAVIGLREVAQGDAGRGKRSRVDRQRGASAASAADGSGGDGGVSAGVRQGGAGYGITGVGGIANVGAVELPLVGERPVAVGHVQAEGERLAHRDGLAGEGGRLRSHHRHSEGMVALRYRPQTGHQQAGHQGGPVGADWGAADAQLAVAVGAHRPQGAVGFHKHGAVTPRRHGHNVAAYTHGPVGVVGAPVAQLAIAVAAHGPQSAVGPHKQGMVVPRRHGHDVAGYTHGPVGVVGAPVAQLAVAVVAHRPQGTVGFHKQGMVRRRHGYDVAGHTHGAVGVVGAPVAQLAKLVAAHGPQGAVGLHK